MPADLAELSAILAPIPGDNPAGRDVHYDPRYDQVREARREDLALPAGGLPADAKLADWALAAKLSAQLLEKESKDLQVAAWLTEARLKREGLSGLAAGLTVLEGILTQYWDTCYPPLDENDLELRAGPLEWVGSRLDIPVRQIAIAPGGVTLLDYAASRGVPTEAEAGEREDRAAAREEAITEGKPLPEVVDRAIEGAPKAFYKGLVAEAANASTVLNSLAKVADERFGRDAPSFTKLSAAVEAVRSLAARILAAKLVDDPDPVDEVPEQDGALGAADDSGPMTPEPANAADAGRRVAVAARYLRAQDSTNPGPYLMLRGLRWGELRASANGDVEPKLLEAPATAVRSRLRGLLLDESWSELLEQCESVLATPQGRGWLDLQRYAVTACDALGSSHDAVGAALRSELRGLLKALPHLPEMTLMDDTPTANAETQRWLKSEGIRAGTSARQDESDESGDIDIGDRVESLDDAMGEEDATSASGGLRAGGRRRGSSDRRAGLVERDAFAAARAELAQGRPNRGIELLLGELARERSPRGRFVRETQVAYMMVAAGLDTVARPILEKLVATIDERKLEDWEAGPLVAQPMALLCRVLSRLDGTSAANPESQLYLRVCRLDPLQAIALQRPTG
jgi:type VI secretion system protein ImpA